MADPWRAFSTRLYDQNLFAIKLGLDNMRRAFSLEGHPEACAPAIVVGGTNGKGTTCAVLSSILQAHGLRVGLFTSPHLLEVRERIRIDGRPASRDDVLRIGREVLKRYGRPDSDTLLTFFELNTLMAARHFAEQRVDVAVWEVGLGGRLDAVNTIEPTMTIVTCIDMDHEAYLGNTIEAIAGEKAALFRSGVPSFIGVQDHVAALATLCAAAPHARVAGEAFPVDDSSIRSRHVSTALEAARHYLGERFDLDTARRAVEATRWYGRLQTLEADGELAGTWILDAAHNPAGARALFAALTDSKVGAFVIGASRDKDARGLFAALNARPEPIFGVVMETRRAATADMLAEWVPTLQMSGNCAAMLRAARDAAGGRPVVVYGSIYLLGEAFAAFGWEADDFVTYLTDAPGQKSEDS